MWLHTQNPRRFPGFTVVVVTFFVKIPDNFHDLFRNQMRIATFPWKNGDHPKRVVDFSSGKIHIPKQNHGNRRGFRRKKLQERQTLEIVEDFACEATFLHLCFFFHHFFKKKNSSFFFHFLQFRYDFS